MASSARPWLFRGAREMNRCFYGLVLLSWLACASKSTPPAPARSQPPGEPEPPVEQGEAVEPSGPSRIEDLYRRLSEDRKTYEEAVKLMGEGEEVDEDILHSIVERIKIGARECAEIEGCEWNRFVDAFQGLLDNQYLVLRSQALRIEAVTATEEEEQEIEEIEEIEPEAGTSPFVSDLPEVGKSVSLLRGTDLRKIIELNGPVKAALDDWLTWLRPELMEAYENYQFLRSRIAPVYEEAGLPEALLFALMATETFGKVHAYSRAGAAGPLQFMPRTGRTYGLRVIDGFDMRLDPVAATKANVAYLNDQFQVLNDSLEKALAAYNGGENRMRRLHRTYKGASLWDSRIYYRLPRETREYVPRVLAAAWLFLHPEDYNLVWPQYDTETTELVVQKDISLGELTICLGQEGISAGWFRTLRNLNPRLNPGERVKAGGTIQVPASVVPVYERQCLGGNLIQTAQALHEANYPYGEMITYVVQPGDTLGRIASRFRCVTTRELGAINNIRPPRYVIRVGQRLRIPNCGY